MIAGHSAAKIAIKPSNSAGMAASKGGALKAQPMKKLIPVLTLAIAALFTAPSAEARGCHSRSYVSFHRSCGGPAWIETYIAYYRSCGRPVFRTRVLPIHRHYRDECGAPPRHRRNRCR